MFLHSEFATMTQQHTQLNNSLQHESVVKGSEERWSLEQRRPKIQTLRKEQTFHQEEEGVDIAYLFTCVTDIVPHIVLVCNADNRKQPMKRLMISTPIAPRFTQQGARLLVFPLNMHWKGVFASFVTSIRALEKQQEKLLSATGTR